MSTVRIQALKMPEKSSRQWLDRFARAALLKMLEHLKIGCLTIREQGEEFCFGESKARTNLIATIHVHHPSAYTDVLFRGTIGSGEAYMMGSWSTTDLLKVIRIFVANMAVINKLDRRFSLVNSLTSLAYQLLKRNSITGSRRNIGAHYDLGNEFFQLFLDSQMMYSSAIYPSWQASLDEAAQYKLQRVCEKLQLTPNDHLLEIGTGWGGMAVYAAKHYGCRVTTITISRQQYDFAQQWIIREGLQNKITLLLQDYRDLSGQFDKIVSIEMIEAVGHRYYDVYFKKCTSLLKNHGLMLIQAITIPDQRYQQAKTSVDFIQKYIFPGGSLPSNEIIAKQIAGNTDMQIVSLEDITAHYAQTLAHWRQRFNASVTEIAKQGFDESFIKMWEYYLCYCEGGFIERVIGTAQFVFAKPQARFVE